MNAFVIGFVLGAALWPFISLIGRVTFRVLWRAWEKTQEPHP